jgi:hypothetical protein
LLQNLPLLAADTGQWNVQVTGLRVITQPEDSKNNFNGALQAPSGVAVEARLTPPAGKIIGIDQFASKLDSFTDDKGTDLLAVKSENPFNKPGFGMMDYSKNTYATVTMQAAGLPAKGATSLNLTGKVALQVADGTNQFTLANVELKAKTAFNLGDLAMAISNVGTNRNSWGAKEYPYSVTFTSLRDLQTIANLEFFDAQGNPIKARKSSWGGGFGGYMMEYEFAKQADRVKIIATCWQGLDTVEVPISIKTGLGL